MEQEFLLAILILVSLAMLGALVVQGRLLRDVWRAQSGRGPEPVMSASPAARADLSGDFEVRPVVDAGGLIGAIEVWSVRLDRSLITLARDGQEAGALAAAAPVRVARVVEAFLQHVRYGRNASSEFPLDGVFLATFTPRMLEAFASGQADFLRGADGGPLAQAVLKSGSFGEHARVLGPSMLVAGGAAGPDLALAALAAASAYMQQRWLEGALRKIDEHIVGIAARLSDDDHGRLHAAVMTAAETDRLLDRGQLHLHHQLRLAMACNDVDAIYLSRRRRIQRFTNEIALQQDRQERERGKGTAWARGVEGAFHDPQEFGNDADLYLRALLARARVHASAAVMLATEARGAEALESTTGLNDALNDDFHDLRLRLEALGREPEGGRLPGRTRPHRRIVGDLLQRIERDVLPVFPPRSSQDVRMRLALPASSALSDGD